MLYFVCRKNHIIFYLDELIHFRNFYHFQTTLTERRVGTAWVPSYSKLLSASLLNVVSLNTLPTISSLISLFRLQMINPYTVILDNIFMQLISVRFLPVGFMKLLMNRYNNKFFPLLWQFFLTSQRISKFVYLTA